MPLRLNIKKKLVSRSERVKAVDLHPTEPWVLSSLYTGKVIITNYETNSVVKTFDLGDTPVRCASFIVRKQWIVCGSDDFKITVYNYNTLDKIVSFDAHNDYIRSVAVHPTLPYILSCSDDMTIRLWDWEQGWKCVRTFEGHSHYTMRVVFNPKDQNMFATASLDHTIKVWNIKQSTPSFTLDGHKKGVNYVDFYQGSDKPFLISASDDGTAKVWDYGTKACKKTLEGHSNNVSICCFHPKLPIIVTGSEDGTVMLWNSSTYKIEDTLSHGLERVWAVSYSSDTKLALGYDGGTIVLKLGSDRPVVSMDEKGKVVLAINNEVQQLTIKSSDSNDGEKVITTSKDLGALELYPVSIKHDSTGRFVAVCGDGEYMLYNAASWRSKQFGDGEQMVWGLESGEYAVKERSGKVKVFNQFKEHKTFRPDMFPDVIFGGHYMGIKSKGFLLLYDWNLCEMITSIEVSPTSIFWNEKGTSVVVASESSYFILDFDVKLVEETVGFGKIPEDGIDDCINLVKEVPEVVVDGQWVGDCFVYTNSQNKLNYYIGGEIVTLGHLDTSCYFLGFVAKNNRVYLLSNNQHVVSYQLHLSVLQYETAIVNGDLESAEKILPSIPDDFHNELARFLDHQGQKKLALSLTKDTDHKFDLSLELGDLEEAYKILKELQSDSKWRQLGGIALSQCDFKLAEECLLAGKDYNGLLLLYSSLGDLEGFNKLAELTLKDGKNNLAFLTHFLTGKLDSCLNILIETKRFPEATFFSKTYLPKETSNTLNLWKKNLSKKNQSIAERLADPIEFSNLFPDFSLSDQVEELLKNEKEEKISSSEYLKYSSRVSRNMIEIVKGNDEGNDEIDELAQDLSDKAKVE